MTPTNTAQVYDQATGTWKAFTPGGSAPVVNPAASPQTGSLQGTMVTPPASTISSPQIPQSPSQGLPQGQFSALLGQIGNNLKTNNNLISQRQLLLKHLFDSPLTPEQKTQLPPDIQSVIDRGDKNAIELQVRVLNDQLQGRANTLDSSIKYLTDAYTTDIADAEKKKQDSINNVLNFAQTYGSNAGSALKSLYGDQYVQQLKDMGIDVDKFSSQPTLAEKKATATGSGSSNQMTDNERALFNQFNGEPIVKDYNTILAKKLTVDQILNSKLGGPGDLSVVYEFMKGLDPTSVVRESEYQTAAKSGNIFAGALAKFNGYLKPDGGFLPENVKKDFQSIVNSKLKVQTQLYDNVKKQYESVAGRQGLNPQNVVIDYSAANSTIGNPVEQLRAQLLPGEILVSREGKDGRHYVAITPDELWATDIKL